jgi:hypothetical protein
MGTAHRLTPGIDLSGLVLEQTTAPVGGRSTCRFLAAREGRRRSANRIAPGEDPSRLRPAAGNVAGRIHVRVTEDRGRNPDRGDRNRLTPAAGGPAPGSDSRRRRLVGLAWHPVQEIGGCLAARLVRRRHIFGRFAGAHLDWWSNPVDGGPSWSVLTSVVMNWVMRPSWMCSSACSSPGLGGS